MKRLIIIGLLSITTVVTFATAGSALPAEAGDLIVGPAAIDAGHWTPVSRLSEHCWRRCDNRCYWHCHRRYGCRRGPRRCYRGTTCHHGVCRDNQTICRAGLVHCPGGGNCYGYCMRRCQWRCRRHYGR